MSDDTLRDRIGYLVSEKLWLEGSWHCISPAYAADAIIEMVREALLSDAAVDAVTDELHNYDLYDTDVRIALIGALSAAGLEESDE